MIEVILDQNKTDTFQDQVRPVYAIEKFTGTNLQDYRRIAREFVARFKDTPLVIIRSQDAAFSNNLFALALFIETCELDTKLDGIIFQVDDARAATEAYKPYIALTIGLKYALRLQKEAPKMIFKEISLLNYLNLNIRQDYLTSKMYISLPGDSPVQKLTAADADEAITVIGIMKTLSLTHCGASIDAELTVSDQPVKRSKEELIQSIIDGVSPWIQC